MEEEGIFDIWSVVNVRSGSRLWGSEDLSAFKGLILSSFHLKGVLSRDRGELNFPKSLLHGSAQCASKHPQNLQHLSKLAFTFVSRCHRCG